MDAGQNAQITDLQNQQQPVYQQPPPVYQQPLPPPAYQQQAPPMAAPADVAEPDTLEQLKQLGALRDSNVLTEAEFEAAKKKILGDL